MSPEPIKASYTDTFAHAFDAKGRITVPSEWRAESYEKRLFAFESRQGCVKVYPESWLSRLQREVENLKMEDPQRLKVQTLASLAQAATWDTQGRMMIKEKLRQKAGLKKDAVLVGCLDHFEIWDGAKRAAQPTKSVTLEEAADALGI